MSGYTIKYNKSTTHITGFEPRTQVGEYGGSDARGKGFVEYAPDSHCPALTRHGVRMMTEATVTTEPSDQPGRVRRVENIKIYTSASEALGAARNRIRIHGGKVCKKCCEAATAVIESTPQSSR